MVLPSNMVFAGGIPRSWGSTPCRRVVQLVLNRDGKKSVTAGILDRITPKSVMLAQEVLADNASTSLHIREISRTEIEAMAWMLTGPEMRWPEDE